MKKVSDCERRLLRLTKDNRETGHEGGEICQLREVMKLFPTVSGGFTLYTNSQTTAMLSEATK